MNKFNLSVLAAVVATLVGCLSESNVDVIVASSTQVSDASAPNDAGPSGNCAPVMSATPLPARLQAQKGTPAASTRTVYVDDLFNTFVGQCGGCHVDVGLGGYQTSRATFADDVDQSWVDSMAYNQAATVMPPPSVGGKLFKDRPADDSANELMNMLQAWVDQGRHRDSFQMVETAPTDAGVATASTVAQYQLDPGLASSLTNIGNCLPDQALYASEKAKMGDMDAKFAAMTFTSAGQGTRQEQIGLPQYLSDTDLVTFDSAELAKMGVLSYAVAYPRWMDPDAAIMRHVRVPLGQSIAFDKNSQQFSIPGGTRFYKTILQRITTSDGHTRWRKIETQVIVSWPNLVNTTGSGAVQSLFGTYAWNDNESQATLVTDPYRNGYPFRDRIVTYISNEQVAATELAKSPANTAYALQNAQAQRSYAIAGSRRCMQCHLGSTSKSFVLGFQPLQVVRRNVGMGGVIDPVGTDELSQLSRFRDLGLITGIETEIDVLPLENSQGTRAPRNEHELVAQGYLLGNCAHCHNPGGDPSLENLSLKDILNFQPSPSGGIFQFPIDRVSPRIFRAGGGAAPSVSMPYVTPSLMEVGPEGNSQTMTGSWTYWIPKCQSENLVSSPGASATKTYPIMAPWRSLIYRGVDTPFTYSDDLALIPHMPMHTQSFDCRAPQIVGDWMVSISAVYTNDSELEYGLSSFNNNACISSDSSVQPYREVTQDQSQFDTAATAVSQRLDLYHNSPVSKFIDYIAPTNENMHPVEPLAPSRYNYCPEHYDIFDPLVLKNPTKQPVPGDAVQAKGQQVIMPVDGVPDHAHWVVYDPTQIPGDWAPRRPDWNQVLVSNIFPAISATGSGLASAQAAQAAEKVVVDVLQSVTLSPAVRGLAQTLVPMGLWQAKSSCNFAGVRSASYYKTDSASGSAQYPAVWMQQLAASNGLKDTDPVYAVTPGEAVHSMICSSCHGDKGDSTGRQATILAEITGGKANVTNLVGGIMVPSNRRTVFASAPQGSATTDDWAARYFAWMGLGGTKQTIPHSILAIVANNKVLSVPRPEPATVLDANMLSSAFAHCADLLPNNLDSAAFEGNLFSVLSEKNKLSFEGGMFEKDDGSRNPQTSLIYKNGDALLWEQVCTTDNPPPVHVLDDGNSWTKATPTLNIKYWSFYDAQVYPKDQPVVDQQGNVVIGITGTNHYPWCLRKPSSDAALAKANQ
jgi:mono/diheme cytochrome c family protein